MSRDRYLTILRYLHFVNNDNAPDPDDVNRDKLWKIRPFLASLLPRFTAVYALSQNLSLDETLIKFKGRVQFRQFLPLTLGLSRTQFHYPVETETRRDCKVHIQRVGTSYQCGICHVNMCPYPCFQRYHTLRDYLFDDPSRDDPKRLKDGNGRPRAGPGRPRQRRSR